MNYYTCIVITEPQPVTGNTALKYRNICNLKSFVAFASKFPGVKYINYYDKKNRRYLGRIYFNSKK